MKAVAIMLALIILVGCQHNPPAPDPRVVAFEAGKREVELDKRLLQECPDLELLVEETDTKTLEAIESWTSSYKACKAWKSQLNRIVRDAFNIGK